LRGATFNKSLFPRQNDSRRNTALNTAFDPRPMGIILLFTNKLIRVQAKGNDNGKSFGYNE
jgi:hypothetical protein